MEKLLYLFIGIILKQAIDEAKAIHAEWLAGLKASRDDLRTYKPNPPMTQGSREAHETIARGKYLDSVRPELKMLAFKIRFVRALPFLAYSLVLIVLIALIAYWEKSMGMP